MGACLKVHFTCCNGKMLPLETHTFAYKLCNSTYVLIYEHVCTYNKCLRRFCGCSVDLDEKLVPAMPVTGWISGSYSALWERKKSKNNHSFHKNRNHWPKKKAFFMIKQRESWSSWLEILLLQAQHLRYFFWRELPLVIWWNCVPCFL